MGSEKGITLIEILVAVTIMALAVAAIFPVFNQGVMLTKEVRDYSALLGLAEGLIQYYIVQISNAPDGSPIGICKEDLTETVRTKFENPVFQSFSKFKVIGTVGQSHLCESGGYEIIIEIEWEVGGKKKHFSLFTIKAANSK